MHGALVIPVESTHIQPIHPLFHRKAQCIDDVTFEITIILSFLLYSRYRSIYTTRMPIWLFSFPRMHAIDKNTNKWRWKILIEKLLEKTSRKEFRSIFYDSKSSGLVFSNLQVVSKSGAWFAVIFISISISMWGIELLLLDYRVNKTNKFRFVVRLQNAIKTWIIYVIGERTIVFFCSSSISKFISMSSFY